jgi:hypothetical protein
MKHGRVAIRNFVATILAILQEIFDETAYARFLQRARAAPSRAAYAEFRREFEQAKARRLKCC